MSTLFFNHLQPPLPEEDYPPEDYPAADPPDVFEESYATGPPTLPKEYTLSHVSRTVIPRANLDRSTPAGWALTVEPNGTWVFTSEHSPDEVTGRLDWWQKIWREMKFKSTKVVIYRNKLVCTFQAGNVQTCSKAGWRSETRWIVSHRYFITLTHLAYCCLKWVSLSDCWFRKS